MAEIVIVVDGPEPLDLDWLVLRVLLVLVPDSEPALLGGTASDVDVRLGHSCGVWLNWTFQIDHLGMPRVHRIQQLLLHFLKIFVNLSRSLFHKRQNIRTLEQIVALSTYFNTRVSGYEIFHFAFRKEIRSWLRAWCALSRLLWGASFTCRALRRFIWWGLRWTLGRLRWRWWLSNWVFLLFIWIFFGLFFFIISLFLLRGSDLFALSFIQ